MSDRTDDKGSTHPPIRKLLSELKALPLSSPKIESVIKALGETGCADVVEPLMGILDRAQTDYTVYHELRWLVRKAVAEALKQICAVDAHALAPIIEQLKRKDSRERAMRLLEGLYWWKPQADEEKVWLAVAHALFDYSESDKNEHWNNLSRMGELAVEPLATVLQEYAGDVFVPKSALLALARTHTPQAAKILLAAFEDPKTALNAATALGQLGMEEAVPHLAAAANSASRAFHAVGALGNIAGTRAREALVKILKEHRNPEIRSLAAFKLGFRKEPDAVEPLVLALGDDGQWTHPTGDGHEIVGYVTEYVRVRAARALGSIGDPRAIEPLQRLEANDSIREVRDAAQKAIQDIEAGRRNTGAA